MSLDQAGQRMTSETSCPVPLFWHPRTQDGCPPIMAKTGSPPVNRTLTVKPHPSQRFWQVYPRTQPEQIPAPNPKPVAVHGKNGEYRCADHTLSLTLSDKRHVSDSRINRPTTLTEGTSPKKRPPTHQEIAPPRLVKPFCIPDLNVKLRV